MLECHCNPNDILCNCSKNARAFSPRKAVANSVENFDKNLSRSPFLRGSHFEMTPCKAGSLLLKVALWIANVSECSLKKPQKVVKRSCSFHDLNWKFPSLSAFFRFATCFAASKATTFAKPQVLGLKKGVSIHFVKRLQVNNRARNHSIFPPKLNAISDKTVTRKIMREI